MYEMKLKLSNIATMTLELLSELKKKANESVIVSPR